MFSEKQMQHLLMPPRAMPERASSKAGITWTLKNHMETLAASKMLITWETAKEKTL